MGRFIKNKLVLLMLFCCVTSAWAKFNVVPIRVEEHLKPGEETTGTYTIRNFDPTPLRIELEWFDKSIESENDTWFEFEKEFVEIPPESTADVNYTIRMPENATGLYYARIRFSENPPEDVPIGISKRYNYPLLVAVEGTQHYDYTVHEIDILNTGVPVTTINIFITNNANVLFRPHGEVLINPVDDESVEYQMDFNPDREVILPQNGKQCSATFIGNMLLPDGEYKALISITSGDPLEEKMWKKTLTFSVENGVATINEY